MTRSSAQRAARSMGGQVPRPRAVHGAPGRVRFGAQSRGADAAPYAAVGRRTARAAGERPPLPQGRAVAPGVGSSNDPRARSLAPRSCLRARGRWRVRGHGRDGAPANPCHLADAARCRAVCIAATAPTGPARPTAETGSPPPLPGTDGTADDPGVGLGHRRGPRQDTAGTACRSGRWCSRRGPCLRWGASPFADLLSHRQIGAGSLSPVFRTAVFVAGWTLMTVAMMLPGSLPLVNLFRRLVDRRPGRAALVLRLVFGYVSVWALFGALAYVGDTGLHEAVERLSALAAAAGAIGAGILLAAGVFQFTPLKHMCLEKCRSPYSFLVEHWGGRWAGRDAVRLGVRHGVFCVGCSWAQAARRCSGTPPSSPGDPPGGRRGRGSRTPRPGIGGRTLRVPRPPGAPTGPAAPARRPERAAARRGEQTRPRGRARPCARPLVPRLELRNELDVSAARFSPCRRRDHELPRALRSNR